MCLISVPVLNSVLNITNFTNDTIFKADQTGLLHLAINREIASVLLDSLLQIPDTTVTSPFTNTLFPVALNPGDQITLTPTDLKFDFGKGIMLKRADIRKGTLHVKFSNDVAEPMDLVYLLPTVTKNGNPFVITETIPTGTNSLQKSYDLSGYSMKLRGISGNAYNTIAQNYSLSLSKTSNSVVVQTGQGAKVEITFSEAIPQLVEGYFGNETVVLPKDTAKLGLINNFKASGFLLSKAKMDFTIVNEFGLEFSGEISNIKGINSVEHQTVVLNGGGLGTINLNRAKRSGDVITPSYKSLNFNETNSNITNFISNLPDKITYEGKIQMNPLGNISGYNDFGYYNTGIRILANIDIPLKFGAKYFELSSKTAVDFSKTEQLENVNSGRFVIYATNGFPFAAQVQGYMYDGKDVLLDSIFISGSNIMAAGQLNAQNEVTAPSKSTIYMPLDRAKIDKLVKCRTIRLRTLFLMPPNPPDIKLLEHYELGINIAAEFNYNVGIK